MTTNEKRNYLYLYDLPKDKVSSVKLAEVFKGEGIDVGEKKPQINRDLFKPFYNAIVHIEDPRMYELAKEKMKYLTIDGCQARALPFDKDLRGDNKAKVMSHNIFYKLAKDADKSQLTYKALHEKFEKYGKIKSTKISLTPTTPQEDSPSFASRTPRAPRSASTISSRLARCSSSAPRIAVMLQERL